MNDVLLPTPETIRARVGELAYREVFGVAACVLQVDGLRREAWSSKVELSHALFATYPRGDIAVPETLHVAGSHKTIDDTSETREQRCSACVIRPGFSPCPMCMGSGAGSSPDIYSRCVACGGDGYLRCSTCDGTTQVVACSIRYINDLPVRVRRALVPPVHESIRPFVEARIDMEAHWPESQAFDPEPNLVTSAYRGASTVRASDDFHGFYFGDARDQCLVARGEATTGLARFTVRTYAIPILWLVTTSEIHTAYFFDASGELQLVTG